VYCVQFTFQIFGAVAPVKNFIKPWFFPQAAWVLFISDDIYAVVVIDSVRWRRCVFMVLLAC